MSINFKSLKWDLGDVPGRGVGLMTYDMCSLPVNKPRGHGHEEKKKQQDSLRVAKQK
jgi:hypothetical protein